MPTYEITSPDGRKFQVTAPEGATQDQVMAYVQAQNTPTGVENAAQRGAEAAAAETTPGQTIGIGAGRVLDRLASGLRSAVPESVRGVVDRAGAAMGMVAPPSIDREQINRDTAAFGALENKNPVSAFVGQALPSLATVNPVSAGAMAALEYGTPEERATRAALSFGASKLGNYIGGKLSSGAGSSASNKAAARASEKVNNSVRDATIKELQDAGYAFPPSQINPTTVNRLAEGFAGKLTTAQNASLKGQSTTNRLFKQELGIPADVPLTKSALISIRTEANQRGYEPIKQFGAIQANKKYAQTLDSMATKYDVETAGMSTLRNLEVEQLFKDASQTQFNSENVIPLLRNLREQGFANKGIGAKAKEVQLGKAQIKVANAIEDLLDDNLKQAGSSELLKNFRDARKLIAKTFTAEKAFNESTGNIEASKIGAMLAKGKPLEGGMLTVGKAANAFPATVKEVKTSLPQTSPLDTMASILAGGASGWNPAVMAIPFMRPAVRAGILSQPYQSAMVNAPNYDAKMIEKLLSSAGKHPEEMKKLGGLLGLFGLQSSPLGN